MLQLAKVVQLHIQLVGIEKYALKFKHLFQAYKWIDFGMHCRIIFFNSFDFWVSLIVVLKYSLSE